MRKIMSEVLIGIMLTIGLLYGNYSGNVTTAINSIQIESQDGYDVVFIEGAYKHTKEIGNPQLPVKILSYLIPLESSVESVTINSSQVEILNNKEYNVYPTQPPLKTGDGDIIEFVEPNEDVYSSGLLYPQKIYEIIAEEYRFGYHIVTIEFYPVQYDTGSKELKIYSNIDFTLNYTGSKESYVLPETQSEKIYEMTRNMIMAQVENPNDMELLSGGAKKSD
ncbi:MAG: hypothetical protein PF638_09800 [Candidatus Delongbacteria bacterium]|jgi:hypothetical protein|nr:hypothetical protein [Candidatus Delongbacteria bacterium]